jgi:hypothetical protein
MEKYRLFFAPLLKTQNNQRRINRRSPMQYIYSPLYGTIEKRALLGNDSGEFIVVVVNNDKRDHNCTGTMGHTNSHLRHVFSSADAALDYINTLNENRIRALRDNLTSSSTTRKPNAQSLHRSNDDDDDDVGVNLRLPPDIQIIGEVRFVRQGSRSNPNGRISEVWNVIDNAKETSVTMHSIGRVSTYIEHRVGRFLIDIQSGDSSTTTTASTSSSATLEDDDDDCDGGQSSEPFCESSRGPFQEN